MFAMKAWFVVVFIVFNLTQSELVYMMYDITSVPTLENVCGLSPTQITDAQQSFKGGHAPQRRRQKLADDVCMGRQRKLVDCLTYEDIAARSLHDRLALDVRSVAGQLAVAKDAAERSTDALFDATGRLDAVMSEHRKANTSADATTRALDDQRDAVRENRRRVDRLHSQLSDANIRMAASISKMEFGHAKDFGVYATGGCQSDGGETT